MDEEVSTVFVVEDAPEVRIALSRMLAAGGYLVRSFESAEQFLTQQEEAAPGCLLLDICMPGLSGIELQRALVGSQCALPIVFLTGMGDIQTSVHAMKKGAVDFLTKPVDRERLFTAIDQALRRDAQQRLEQTICCSIKQRFETLTPRERTVMAHVVRGRLNKQIAGDLGTGEKTVKVHRARVMTKMKVRSVADLVRLGARIGVAFEPTTSDGEAARTWRQTARSTLERVAS